MNGRHENSCGAEPCSRCQRVNLIAAYPLTLTSSVELQALIYCLRDHHQSRLAGRRGKARAAPQSKT
jgi:hypothetical protein